MSVLKFKHITRPQILQQIGRSLLLRLFEKFNPQSANGRLALPPPELPDPEWFGALGQLFSSPEVLPDGLVEALYAIDEMSSLDGQEQLEAAAARAGLRLEFVPGSTRHDLALQIWLAAPGLLARVHNQTRLRRLSAFECFGTPLPVAERPLFVPPVPATLEALKAILDPWFARHQRGTNTSRVELYITGSAGALAGEAFPAGSAGALAGALSPAPADDSALLEYWFLIRHGDTYARAPKVDEQKTEIIHYRPQRDDVVVYSPRHDEIRINSRTRGERDLYGRAFGQCLRGKPDYFSARNTYTLDPLREAGEDALQSHDIQGLDKVVLRELDVAEDNEKHSIRLASEDLFRCPAREASEPIPRGGRLRCAAFDLHFSGCPRPRPLHVRPPNVLKLGRHCDARVAHAWLTRRAFRVRPT